MMPPGRVLLRRKKQVRSIAEISVSGGIKMALTPDRASPTFRLAGHKTVALYIALLEPQKHLNSGLDSGHKVQH
jgi:hypothetical protein